MPHKVDSATLKKSEVHSPHAKSEHINRQTKYLDYKHIPLWSLVISTLVHTSVVICSSCGRCMSRWSICLIPIWKLDIPALILRGKAQLSILACFKPYLSATCRSLWRCLVIPHLQNNAVSCTRAICLQHLNLEIGHRMRKARWSLSRNRRRWCKPSTRVTPPQIHATLSLTYCSDRLSPHATMACAHSDTGNRWR